VLYIGLDQVFCPEFVNMSRAPLSLCDRKFCSENALVLLPYRNLSCVTNTAVSLTCRFTITVS